MIISLMLLAACLCTVVTYIQTKRHSIHHIFIISVIVIVFSLVPVTVLIAIMC